MDKKLKAILKVQEAENDLVDIIDEWRAKHKLTDMERMQVYINAIQNIIKYQLIAERGEL